MIEIREAPTPVETLAPLEPTTPVKPSEYLRLGMMTTLPWQRSLVEIWAEERPWDFDEPVRVSIRSACALGAIAVGAGLSLVYGIASGDSANHMVQTHTTDESLRMEDLLRTTGVGAVPCPCPSKPMSVSDAVIHLNDSHAWDRPRTADWLESIGL